MCLEVLIGEQSGAGNIVTAEVKKMIKTIKMINPVKQKREEKGITQLGLSKLADVIQSTISNIETRRCIPRIDIALHIAHAVQTTVRELFLKNKYML